MNKKILNLSKLLLTVAFALSILACAFSLNFASADTSVSIYDGGSIRYDEYEGIRFTAYVADSLFDDPAIKDLKDGVTVGMYVVPSTLAGNVEEIDESTSGVKTVSTSSDSFVWQGESDKDGYQQYNVVIYGIPSSDYNTQILARAFVDNNGEKDLSATVSRSITNVANATLAGDTLVAEDDDYKLTDTQIEKLNKYVSATETLTDVVIGRIVDGVAKWDAVEGALGYIVKTDKDMFKTTDTQVDLNGATEVSVVAYSDGASKTYSVVDSATVHELEIGRAHV